jgi:hypothetical protein
MDAAGTPHLFAFTHARWDAGVGRTQELLARLAAHYRIHVVEAPVTTHEDPWLACSEPAPGVERLVPHTRIATGGAAGFHPDQLPTLRALLGEFARSRGLEAPLAWLGTPQAWPLAAGLAPRAVIYDCTAAPGPCAATPAPLREHEAALLREADLVLAAGPSLYGARRGLHANVHCIPDAVDPDHFAPPPLAGSSIEAVSARSLHAPIPAPRLGWHGVIDERLDLALVAAVAQARPDWHLVMAGPLAGIDEDALPRRPNIHWIGPQTHAILPHLQAHWDVCLLPLKCDAPALFASPLQTLQYLAGHKPVVSTRVRDVVALFGHVVRIADDAAAFVEACRASLCERGPVRRQRRLDALVAAHGCTWDRAAERIRGLLAECTRPSVDTGRPRAALQPPALALARGFATRFALN